MEHVCRLWGKNDFTVAPNVGALLCLMGTMLLSNSSMYILINQWSSRAMQIVNWRTHLKFPEEAKLSAEAKDLICKLLCNVEQRLGTKGAHEIKVRIHRL